MLRNVSSFVREPFVAPAIALVALALVVSGLTPEDRALGIRTRIGDYTSFQPIGHFPIGLVYSLQKWPNRDSCLLDANQEPLRWKEFGSITEIEVCFSNVFGMTMDDIDIVAALQANGFDRASVQPSASRFNSAKTTISALCERAAAPCGLALENFLSFPFVKSYAYSVKIFRLEGITLGIHVVEQVK
jgi:hypothetical protein